jgi:hypothetical protein
VSRKARYADIKLGTGARNFLRVHLQKEYDDYEYQIKSAAEHQCMERWKELVRAQDLVRKCLRALEEADKRPVLAALPPGIYMVHNNGVVKTAGGEVTLTYRVESVS